MKIKRHVGTTEYTAPSVGTAGTKESMVTKKRMLTTKNANILENFGEYYCQSKQYWYKNKILQALEGASGVLYMARRQKLSWDKRRDKPRLILPTLEFFADLSWC